jgi:hypothetical protein
LRSVRASDFNAKNHLELFIKPMAKYYFKPHLLKLIKKCRAEENQQDWKSKLNENKIIKYQFNPLVHNT